MTSEQFDYLRKFLKEQSGLVLGEDKRYLIDSRLNPVAREFDHESIGDMVVAMKRPGAQKLLARVSEAMTINESFFFRDMTPFDNFRNTMLPHMIKERATTRRLRIWSAAASTGQEGYSLAMELLEQKAKMPGWKIEILGTDLSSDALDKAKAGRYSQFEVQRGMASPMLVKYFRQDGTEWAIQPEVKSMVSFKHFNLLRDFRALGQFDIVFCRNVLIYFDRETKADILSRLAKQVAKDAYLVLGAAETIVGLNDDFEMVKGARGLYQRRSNDATTSRTPDLTGNSLWKEKPAPGLASAPRASAPMKTGATGSAFAKTR